MSPRKRIRPLMSVKEIFSISRSLIIFALLISCAAVVWSVLFIDTLSLNIGLGAIIATLIFTLLAAYMISFPFMYMGILARTGVDETAKIIAVEEQEGTLLMPAPTTLITFEFAPQGALAPIQLTAQVTKVASQLLVGGMAKIRYAKSNPRIVKFDGE